MYFVETLAGEGLGSRGYLAGGETAAVAMDPPRNVEPVLAAAARRGVSITHVVESHIHTDHVTGGLELARLTGARYLVPAAAQVSFSRMPVADGDRFDLEEGLALQAMATPGHTPHHTSYVLRDGGAPVAVFTGGSLLVGTVGRPDLVEPRLTEQLARAQHTSAHRLTQLPDEVRVLPTHGFGGFCSASPAEGESTTIGEEKLRNPALTEDVEVFAAQLLAGLDDVPAYYPRVGLANAAGPDPVDLTEPQRADAAELAVRLAAGEWLVDLRNRAAFAEEHLAGSYNFAMDSRPATHLAWLVPWGRPVTLLGESAEQIAAAQRELVQVGIDRPAAAAIGSPKDWAVDDSQVRSFARARFTDLAAMRAADEQPVALDVRRGVEYAAEHIEGAIHIPLHQLRDRLGEIPAGTVWVHCAGGVRAGIAASLLDAAGRHVVAVDDAFRTAHSVGLTTRPA